LLFWFWDESMKRRDVLRIGGLGACGLAGAGMWPPAARGLEAKRGVNRPTVKSCILMFQPGGPSQHDTWDPKPDAPREVRGEFEAIATSAPGVWICEHLPRMARVADRIAIVRGVHHRMRDHNTAAVQALTGHPPVEADGTIFADHANSFPCYGAVLNHLIPARRDDLPAHVALPHVVTRGVKLPGQEPGFLGSDLGPFQLARDPISPSFEVSELALTGDALARLEARTGLRRALGEQLGWLEKASTSRAAERHYDRALRLLSSSAVRTAFEIDREDPKLRDRYGRTKHGQSVLLARRLVEAGVRFVTVNFAHGDADIGGGDDWDTHFGNFDILRNITLPATDLAFSALIEDLDERGLLDETLIVWLGEFGRTPRVTNAEGGGRDHWPDCFSVVLAGGGIRGGVAHGASDAMGAFPAADPVEPADLAATLFWRFGLDPMTEIVDRSARPFPIAAGEPLTALFG
jgi:hypothetical protein